MKKKYIYIVLILLLTKVSMAQQDYSVFPMESIPQRSNINPALTPDSKFNISFPGLSSVFIGIRNTGFSYNDVLEKKSFTDSAGNTADSLVIRDDNFISALQKTNFISAQLDLELFSFGFRFKHANYLRFSLANRTMFRSSYHKDMMNFAINGNGVFVDENRAANFNLGIDFLNYHEFAIGYTREIDYYWTAGIRPKLLVGLANVWTEKNKINIFTHPDTYAMTANTDFTIHTSLPVKSYVSSDSVNVDSSFFDNFDDPDAIMDYVQNFDNMGFGLDLGVQYRVNHNLKVSASVVDLGFINWKTNAKKIANNAQSTFEGLDINDFFGSDDSTGFADRFEEVLDTLQNDFELKEEAENSYRSPLITRFYLGGIYNLSDRDRLSALFKGEFYFGELFPAATFAYNRKFNNFFNLTTSYTIEPNNYLNFGAGFSMNAGFFQIYFLSDNLYSLISPNDTKTINAHFGINLTFGRKIKKDEKRYIPSFMRNMRFLDL